MAKQKAKTATPRLRFPEFRGLEPWSPRPLIGLADKRVKWSFSGGPFGSNLKASDYASRGVRIIQLQNIGDGEFLSDYKIYTSTSKADELQSCNIYPGEILLSKMGDPVGRACIVPESENRYVMCSDGIRLVVDKKQFSRDFVFFAINFDSFRRRVEAASTGSTRKRIGLDVLKQLPLDVPQLAEQQKIADCLTSLDEVIAAQGRKVEALKAHKRGLMQQLFPREGETRPRLRFPEFRDAPEWRNVVLGDVSTIVRGGSPRPIDDFLTVEPDGLNWLKIGDVDREAKYITATEEKVRVEALSKTRVIRPGDFILSNSMSFGRPYISAIDACIHDGWIAVTRIHKTVVHEFLYYSILSERSQTYFANQAAGSGVQNLNKDIIKLLPVAVPSKREQQRIADCLASLDTRITAESNRLAAFKTHKQGLMQQLFPASESV